MEEENTGSEKETENIAVMPATSNYNTPEVSTTGSGDCNDKLICAEEIVYASELCEHECSVDMSHSRADRLCSGENVMWNETKQECMDTVGDTAYSQDTNQVTCTTSEKDAVQQFEVQIPHHITDSANSYGPHQVNGIERVTINRGSDATPPDPTLLETSTIPIQAQDDTVQQSFLPLNGEPETHELGRSLPDEDLCQERYISVAVQCSPEISSLQMAEPLTLEDKSTQTFVPKYTDAAVQTADDTTSDETSGSGCISTDSTAGSKQTKKADEVFALKRELDSMQNTVIWQALMLRLYQM